MNDSALPAVLETSSFVVTPCFDCDVPGYLIARPRTTSATLADLAPLALAELGPTLAAIERAVLRVTGAERIYVARFSEGLAAVHFHVFPRTAELAMQWRRARGDAEPAMGDVNGPLLFDWARVAYHVAPGQLSPRTLATAARITAELAQQV